MAPLSSVKPSIIRSRVDVYEVRRKARALALAAGFDPISVEEIVLAVSELATNLARYTTDGAMILETVDENGASGLRIETVDGGPGLGDVDQAVKDGFSTGGGLGVGFGSIRRATDRLDIQSSPAGTRIVAYKWLTPPSS